MRFVRLAILLFAVVLPSHSANDPFTATWKLDVSKSKFRAEPPKESTLTIQANDDELTLVRELLRQSGPAPKLTISANFGGKLYGVINSPEVDAVKCWRKDKRTIMLQLLQSGATVSWWTVEVSKDGKSLKLTSSTSDAKGKETQFSETFDRL